MAIGAYPGRWTARGSRQPPRRRPRPPAGNRLAPVPDTSAFRGLLIGLVVMLTFWLLVLGVTLLLMERIIGVAF